MKEERTAAIRLEVVPRAAGRAAVDGRCCTTLHEDTTTVEMEAAQRFRVWKRTGDIQGATRGHRERLNSGVSRGAACSGEFDVESDTLIVAEVAGVLAGSEVAHTAADELHVRRCGCRICSKRHLRSAVNRQNPRSIRDRALNKHAGQQARRRGHSCKDRRSAGIRDWEENAILRHETFRNTVIVGVSKVIGTRRSNRGSSRAVAAAGLSTERGNRNQVRTGKLEQSV